LAAAAALAERALQLTLFAYLWSLAPVYADLTVANRIAPPEHR
jgi:hypothetical protein